GARDEVGHDARAGRGGRRGARDHGGPPGRRSAAPHARPVPPAVSGAPPGGALRTARRVRGARRRRPGPRVPPRRGRPARALLVSRQAPGQGGLCGSGGGMMQYVPIVMVFAIALGVACLLAYLPALLGPRRATPIKLDTFECGKDLLARPEGRFAIKFSTTAIFFIIVDIELMFVFSWTVVYRSLGFYGFVTMVVYLGILMLGLLYVWRKGGLQWE